MTNVSIQWLKLARVRLLLSGMKCQPLGQEELTTRSRMLLFFSGCRIDANLSCHFAEVRENGTTKPLQEPRNLQRGALSTKY